MDDTQNMPVSTAAQAARWRLSACLGLGLETRLQGREPSWMTLPTGWDAWWVATRSGGTLLPGSATSGTCRSCRAAARAGSPEARAARCACFGQWAAGVQADQAIWPLPQRLTVAMIKPGVQDGPIRARLRRRFRVTYDATRRLTPGDITRLHPHARGDQLDALGEHLVGRLGHVLVLAGGDDAVAEAAKIKQAVRVRLACDEIHDGLHTPQTPGDALADIALLADPDVLKANYEWWVKPHEDAYRARMRAYLSHLGTPGRKPAGTGTGSARPAWRGMS